MLCLVEIFLAVVLKRLKVMSRIGKIPVTLPANVKIAIQEDNVRVEGPKGKLSLPLPTGISVEQKDNQLMVKRSLQTKQVRANHGTIRAHLVNMVEGVTQGHKKSLDIQGVGFRAQLKGETLTLNLGLSHSVDYTIPKEVKVSVPQPTEIHIEGPDKALVGQVASQLRSLRPPEPYKGKGVRYSGELVRRKQGKAITK